MKGEGVYILRLSRPLGNGRHSASFYVGWTRNIEGRLFYHKRGQGSNFTRAAIKRGIDFELVLFIPGAGRDVERQIKARKNTRRFLEQYARKQKKAQVQ